MYYLKKATEKFGLNRVSSGSTAQKPGEKYGKRWRIRKSRKN